VAIGLLALALGGCSTAQPTPSPTDTPSATDSGPPVGGPGWTLLRTLKPAVLNEGLATAALGPDQFVLSITVVGGGSDGCETPTLAGFRPSGTVLTAVIERSPTAPNTICTTAFAVTFYVALDRSIVTPAITQIALSENCATAGCVVPVPTP
jgi:hypothetical protein